MSNSPDQTREFPFRYPRHWSSADAHARYRALAAGGRGEADHVDLFDVADTPCLILLGEPGSGKSWELERLQGKLRESARSVDLIAGRAISHDPDLSRLFPSGAFQRWERDGGPWHVLIDGIDEIGAGEGAAVSLLSALLDQLQARARPGHILCVAMSCRTASWSTEMDAAIDARWPSNLVRKLALDPLDDTDVRIGIASVEPDPVKSEQLASLLIDDNLGAIAGRPLLLGMMLDRYRTEKVLPVTQSALFQGVIDAQLSRGDERDGAPTVSQKLLLAGRIAAASSFSGYTRIATSLTPDTADSLIVNHIAGGTERSSRGRFAVTPVDLLDVLGSGLFVEISRGAYEFRHRAFRDYLTARYLVDHRLTGDQMMSLLSVQELNGPGGVAPQLQEVAAWAAAMAPDLFDLLIAREPAILLKSDTAAMTAADRARLTAAVLQRFANEDMLDQHATLVPLFLRLDHDALAEQLKPLIADAEAPSSLRMVAIDIAGLTGKTTLVPSLSTVARDEFADILVRTWAVRAIGRLGSDEDIGALAPILTSDLSADEDDRLRGALLRLCWPAHLEFQKLLNALTAPKQRNQIGTYHLFLHRLRFVDLMPGMAVDAVRWLQNHIASVRRRDSGLQEIATRLFWSAAAKIDFAEVRTAFGDLILEAGSDLPHVLVSGCDDDRGWSPEPHARSTLVIDTISRSADPARTTSTILYFLSDLVSLDDLDDYLVALPGVESGAVRTALAQIIVLLCDRSPINELTAVWEVAAHESELHVLLKRRYSVEWPSEQADRMREEAMRAREREAEREGSAEAEARWREDITTLLNRIEAGEPDLWWRVNYDLMRDASGYRSDFEFRSDLDATPGWKLLDGATRERIVATAPIYLTRAPLADTSWLGSDTSNRAANAGVRALSLMHDRAPEQLSALPADTWAAWAPALLGFFDNAFHETGEAQCKLVEEAYRRAPDAVLGAVRDIALGERSRGLTPRIFELLEGILSPAVVKLLEQLRTDPNLRGDSAASEIFSFLVRMGVAAAVGEVTTALERAPVEIDVSAPTDRASLTRAAAELVLRGSLKVWGLLLQLRGRDDTLATEIWHTLAEETAFDQLPLLDLLDAYSLGQGYIDLAQLLPERPPVESGARVLGVADHVERLRAMIIGRLVAMGTNAALEQLERIATAIPADREALRWRINEARRNVRARTATRPDPADILLHIGAMGQSAAPDAVSPDTSEPVFQDDTDDVPVELDLAAPVPEPEGPLPEKDRRIILAVATEWSSATGGISTLNRELCVALAALGHGVACLVQTATTFEIDEAKAMGITLIACPTSEGIDPRSAYLLCDERHIATPPQVVIGHDHITGQFGRALASRFDSKYVHFLHTIPQENEGMKGNRGDMPRPILSGNRKSDAQIRLASLSDLVVAVGPRIRRMFDQVEFGCSKITTFIPGLNESLLKIQPKPDEIKVNQCLMIGRMEDAGVKGVRLACEVLKAVTEGRRWPIGEDPKLLLRGFSLEHADDEIAEIEDFRSEYGSFATPLGYSTDATMLQIELGRSVLFVMPSKAEGFGLTGLEALAAGIPVILSAQSGLAEFLDAETKTGFLAEALIEPCIAPVTLTMDANIADWKTKVELVMTDRAAAFERAGQIRQSLSARYSWAATARKFSSELALL